MWLIPCVEMTAGPSFPAPDLLQLETEGYNKQMQPLWIKNASFSNFSKDL